VAEKKENLCEMDYNQTGAWQIKEDWCFSVLCQYFYFQIHLSDAALRNNTVCVGRLISSLARLIIASVSHPSLLLLSTQENWLIRLDVDFFYIRIQPSPFTLYLRNHIFETIGKEGKRILHDDLCI